MDARARYQCAVTPTRTERNARPSQSKNSGRIAPNIIAKTSDGRALSCGRARRRSEPDGRPHSLQPCHVDTITTENYEHFCFLFHRIGRAARVAPIPRRSSGRARTARQRFEPDGRPHPDKKSGARRREGSSTPVCENPAGPAFFYFACTRETRATPQSHDDNDNGNDSCNENDNLCAIVHREVKPPQKRLAPAQTTFHAPFRPRARRNPTTPAWAGTHRTPTTFEWPRWRQAVFRRPRVRRGSLPARTCIPVLWSRNPTEDVPVGYTYDVRGGWPLTVVDAFHRGCLPPSS